LNPVKMIVGPPTSAFARLRQAAGVSDLLPIVKMTSRGITRTWGEMLREVYSFVPAGDRRSGRPAEKLSAFFSITWD
jgi:hypothetical protein